MKISLRRNLTDLIGTTSNKFANLYLNKWSIHCAKCYETDIIETQCSIDQQRASLLLFKNLICFQFFIKVLGNWLTRDIASKLYKYILQFKWDGQTILGYFHNRLSKGWYIMKRYLCDYTYYLQLKFLEWNWFYSFPILYGNTNISPLKFNFLLLLNKLYFNHLLDLHCLCQWNVFNI